MKTRYLVPAILAAVILASHGRALAQQRPLVTEDPETVGTGLVLIEAGFDVQRSAVFPVSGLEGTLLRAPVVGVSIGVGPVAELQIDGGFFNRLRVKSRRPAPLSNELLFTGDETHDVEDLVIGTKLKLWAEGPRHPAIALRFATRLPNAGNESGLGLDTFGFDIGALVGKTVQSIRVVGNLGIAIVGDPTKGSQQGDLVTYGLSLARAVRQGVEVVGEINGRYATTYKPPPPGSESRAMMRAGARLTTGTVRFDTGVLVGMTSRDPSIGFTAGLTWVFRGFKQQP